MGTFLLQKHHATIPQIGISVLIAYPLLAYPLLTLQSQRGDAGIALPACDFHPP